MTENHNYNAPAEGEQNWDALLNENFEFLDVDVPIVDAELNLGQYDPTENTLFTASDTGRRYVGDGTQWISISDPVGAGDGISSGDGGGSDGSSGTELGAWDFAGVPDYPISVDPSSVSVSDVVVGEVTEEELERVQNAIAGLY